MQSSKIELEDIEYYHGESGTFRHGNLTIENGIIRSIEDSQRKSEGNLFVIPGFINTHAHIAMSRFRGLLDDMNLEKFLQKTFALDRDRSEDDIYNSSVCGIYELLRNGITSFFDLYYDEHIIWQACNDMGIRAFLSWNTLDREMTTQNGDPVHNAGEFIKKFRHKNELIEPSVGIQGVYVASLETMEAANEVSRKNNTILHMHVSETRKEVYEFQERMGKRPVEYLNENSLLSHRMNAAHCVWLNDHEIKALGKNEVNVSWNAESNLKLGTGGIPPVPEMIKQNINITVGTDSNGSNNSLNILESAKTGAISIKNTRWDASLITSREVFYMLTLNGGKASRKKYLGEIREGAPADLNIIDGDHHSIQCSNPNNVLNQIVYSMNPEAIRDTIIGGKYIKKDWKMNNDAEEKFRNSLKFLKSNFKI
ncbi:MAG: amidohydrolase family protein [Cuniculiplasma sp.]